jgi:hypothetical protein
MPVLTPNKKMVLTAHQSSFLPWMGLFHKIAIADKFVHFDQVQYCSKDWMNRNKIKTDRGYIWLSVPVLNKDHRSKKISDIEINNQTRWKEKHWKSIYLAYKKARYFNDYAAFFEDVYKRDWKYLIELNNFMFDWYLKTLGIKTEIDYAANYKFEGSKNDLVLDMCKKLEADIYIFGGQGQNYANRSAFRECNIVPYFQEYIHPKYTQLHGEFIPYMGIIDLLFNEGPRSLDIIMSSNIKKITLDGSVR